MTALRALPVAALTAALASGCAAGVSFDAPGFASRGATFCQVYDPVRWHSADTRKTKEQADRENRKWVALSCDDPSADHSATFCEVYAPIRWHSADTRRTKEQIDKPNRAWKVLGCENKG